jgi:hypothetical protein
MEINGKKALLGELKSEWEIDRSIKGGPGTATGGESRLGASKLKGQFAVEDKILDYARKVNGKVTITGYDVKTGLRIEGEFDPGDVSRGLFSSTSGGRGGLGNEYTQ